MQLADLLHISFSEELRGDAVFSFSLRIDL